MSAGLRRHTIKSGEVGSFSTVCQRGSSYSRRCHFEAVPGVWTRFFDEFRLFDVYDLSTQSVFHGSSSRPEVVFRNGFIRKPILTSHSCLWVVISISPSVFLEMDKAVIGSAITKTRHDKVLPRQKPTITKTRHCRKYI